MDGVIFDSEKSNIEFYNHILNFLGQPAMKPEDVAVIHRESMVGSLHHLLGDGELYQKAMDFWMEMPPDWFLHRLRLFPNVKECLDLLATRYDLAVATNRAKTTRAALDHFGLWKRFKTVVTPLNAGVDKPHPKVMELVLAGLGARKDQVVYVGDSLVDEQLCVNSEVRLIGFRDPDLHAWAHVDDLLEIPALLGVNREQV